MGGHDIESKIELGGWLEARRGFSLTRAPYEAGASGRYLDEERKEDTRGRVVLLKVCCESGSRASIQVGEENGS